MNAETIKRLQEFKRNRPKTARLIDVDKGITLIQQYIEHGDKTSRENIEAYFKESRRLITEEIHRKQRGNTPTYII